MLETIAKVPDMRNPDIAQHDKWLIVHAVGEGDNKYYGLGCWDTTGKGYGD